MEKVAQHIAITEIDVREVVQLDQPETLSLEQLEAVAGGFDGGTDLPAKGW